MEYVVQGKKGNGKGIIALKMIETYLLRGRPVATNLNLNLEHLLPPESKTFVYRLPDQPNSRDMEALGTNPTGGDETKNGLIVLDECASWLNARDYKDKDRQRLLDWFLHSRKYGWDVVYIIQSINALDKQFRDGFAEHLVDCQRLDRLPVPFIGGLVSMLGATLRMPKIHVGTVRYGTSPQAPVVERIFCRGRRFYKAYDTLQRFTPFNEFQGLSCQLPAYHVHGRYHSRWKLYKSVFAGSLLAGLFTGAVLTASAGVFLGYKKPEDQVLAPLPPVELSGWIVKGGKLVATLPDGNTITTNSFTQNAQGVSFVIDRQTYRGQNQ